MTALGTRLLTLDLGGSDYTAQVSNCRITSGAAETDFISFLDAANGGAREYKLAFTAVQDPAVDTLWDKVFSTPGTVVAGVVMPNGGNAPTPETPAFEFNATITEPDGDLLGGEANASQTARFTFECEWSLTAKPVRKTA